MARCPHVSRVIVKSISSVFQMLLADISTVIRSSLWIIGDSFLDMGYTNALS